MVPSVVSARKPARPAFLRTEVTSTPHADRCSDLLRVGDEVVRDLFLGRELVWIDVSESKLGNRSCQAGPFATSESQRSDRQRSAMRWRSRTRCCTSQALRCSLIARPACPPPTTSTSTISLDISTPLGFDFTARRCAQERALGAIVAGGEVGMQQLFPTFWLPFLDAGRPAWHQLLVHAAQSAQPNHRSARPDSAARSCQIVSAAIGGYPETRPGARVPRFDVLLEPVQIGPVTRAQPLLPGAALQRHGLSRRERARRRCAGSRPRAAGR